MKQAKTLGLPTVFTPYGPYYINRKQGNSEQDPPNAGDGSDHVKNTYACDIPAEVTGGVQGTFWTENVSNADLMEWSALPRLIAIAERGWSPESSKNFVGFQKRMTADTVLLNYGGYKYCKYYMLGEEAPGTTSKVLPRVNTADKKYYYRIVSGGEDAARSGRCIEVLAEGSPLIATYQGNGAAAGRLWTNTQAAATDNNYDNQWWSLEEDPKPRENTPSSAKPSPTVLSTPCQRPRPLADAGHTTRRANTIISCSAQKVTDRRATTITIPSRAIRLPACISTHLWPSRACRSTSIRIRATAVADFGSSPRWKTTATAIPSASTI